MLAARRSATPRAWQGEIAVAGGHLPVWTAGEGDGARAPAILLHGWTLDHRMWRPQVEGLAASHFLVMPDRRGCGRATAPPDLAREAEDVLAIADALGLDRFALVGLSQGAVAALGAALLAPARVTHLALAGAPLPALVPRDEVIDREALRALVAHGDLAGFRAAWGAHPLMQTRTPEAAALVAEILADYDGRDLLAPSEAPAIAREAIAALPMPVLALAGEHDTPWRRACARALGATAPRARQIEIAAAGHLANADNPQAFDDTLAAFLASGTPA